MSVVKEKLLHLWESSPNHSLAHVPYTSATILLTKVR